MATYEVTSPDGQRYQIDGPDGASHDQVMAYAKSQWAQSMTHQPGPKPTDVVGAFAEGAKYRADKIASGITQMTHSGDEAVQRGLATMDKAQDARVEPVKKEHPFAFGAGDSLPLMAVPGGQATTLARIAAPAVGAGIMEAMSYGSPEERAKRAGVAALAGAAGGAAGEGLGRLIKPMRGESRVPQEVLDAAERLGINLTAGQRSGSKALLKVEDTMSQTPFAQSVMQGSYDAQRTAINQAAARAAGGKSDLIDAKFLSGAMDAAKAERGALEAAAQVSPVDVDLLVGIRNAQQRLGAMQQGPASLANTKPAEKIIKDFSDFVTTAQGPMDGKTYQSWKTLLTNAKDAAYKADDSSTGAVYKDLLTGLNEAAQKGAKDAWKASDRKFATLDILQNGNAVNEATGNVNPGTLAQKFMTKYGDSAKQGKLPGELQDIALFAKGVAQPREGSQTAGRLMWGGMLGGAAGASALANPMAAAGVAAVPAVASRMLTTPSGAAYITQGLAGKAPAVQRLLLEQAQRAGVIGAGAGLSLSQ